MYIATLHLHRSLWALALILPAVILFKAALNWSKKRGPSQFDNRMVNINVWVFRIQLLIGLILYAFLSPITQAAFADFKAAMKNAELRYFAVEHITLMIVAVVLAHLIKILPAKKEGVKSSISQMVWALVLFIVIVIGTPWGRFIS